jgi:hypothetical protein
VWLESEIARASGQVGTIAEIKRKEPLPNRHPFYELEYGKRSSIVLLPLLYPANAPCLERKRAIWDAYAKRHGFVG